MYLAFAVLALAVALLASSMLRLERQRKADIRTLQLASAQRTAAHQIGRLAALVALSGDDPAARAVHVDALALVVQQSGVDALLMDGTLARRLAERGNKPGEAAQRLPAALERWQAARERLWYRSEVLLRHPLRSSDDNGSNGSNSTNGSSNSNIPNSTSSTNSDAGAGQADGLGKPGAVHNANAERADAGVQRAARALQAEVAPAAEAAAALSTVLGSADSARAGALRDQVKYGMGGLLLLLLLLGLAVVEPTARSVRRHARRLAQQSTELQRLALVAEHTTALVLITDCHDLVQWANTAFSMVSGWSLADATGRRPGELLASAQADEAVLTYMQAAIRHGLGARREWLHRTRDGRELWLDVDLRPLRAADGTLSGFVRVASDVTERVQQQAKLQALWAVLPAGVLVHDSGGAVVEANRAAERLLGLSLAQLQQRDSRPDDWRAVREDGSDYPDADHPASRTLRSGEAVHNEIIGLHGAGSLRWLLVNSEPQRDALGHVSGVVTCVSDITERRHLQERLSASARTDALTRLPNRAVVMERLQHAIGHARRHAGYGFAVLFMDFDRFKQVNDTLGHAAGDELLRQIAQRLQRTLRPGDAVARLHDGQADMHVAARLGGDEFVVVLEGVADAATVSVIADRLLHDLAEPYHLGSTPVQSSVSIGVVLCAGLAAGQDGDGGEAGSDGDSNTHSDSGKAPALTADDVLRNADTAMYEAKRAGRARWVLFDDSMHERVVRALALETDLRRALKDDELFVVYQPVVDLRTRTVDSVEALVRWRHPERGLVQPADFISAAEECGLIDAVGSTVLRKACRQFMQWRRTPGAPAPRLLAVNLSRAQLARIGLVDDVRAVLHDCGMAPALLQLEVTESLAAQDDRVLATLRELKALGVKLALDDFGTGYSSLACLHQMPVDTVKIDRSFVQHAETVEYHRVLIEATIRVARTLGMTTVAEGIETEGQAALMLELDCDRGQGYLFSRPLEPADLERWTRRQARREAADTA